MLYKKTCASPEVVEITQNILLSSYPMGSRSVVTSDRGIGSGQGGPVCVKKSIKMQPNPFIVINVAVGKRRPKNWATYFSKNYNSHNLVTLVPILRLKIYNYNASVAVCM
jgi:hypothetical protein